MNTLITLLLAIALAFVSLVSIRQDNVIAKQKTLIEDMVTSPACSNAPETDPTPELPAYELPLEQRTL